MAFASTLAELVSVGAQAHSLTTDDVERPNRGAGPCLKQQQASDRVMRLNVLSAIPDHDWTTKPESVLAAISRYDRLFRAFLRLPA